MTRPPRYSFRVGTTTCSILEDVVSVWNTPQSLAPSSTVSFRLGFAPVGRGAGGRLLHTHSRVWSRHHHFIWLLTRTPAQTHEGSCQRRGYVCNPELFRLPFVRTQSFRAYATNLSGRKTRVPPDFSVPANVSGRVSFINVRFLTISILKFRTQIFWRVCSDLPCADGAGLDHRGCLPQ